MHSHLAVSDQFHLCEEADSKVFGHDPSLINLTQNSDVDEEK